MNQDNFQTIFKSSKHIIGGSLLIGGVLSAISNSLNLISVNLSLALTAILILAYFYLRKWIKTNKPYWKHGESKVTITKPNAQINLFFFGATFIIFIPFLFQWTQNKDFTNAVIIQKTELILKDYIPKSEISFRFNHHVKNESQNTFKNYQFTNYSFVFNKDWQLESSVKTHLNNYSSFVITPGKGFIVKDDKMTWASKDSTLYANHFVGFIESKFTDTESNESFKNRSYYNLVFDKSHTEISVHVPTDIVLEHIREPIDSIMEINAVASKKE